MELMSRMNNKMNQGYKLTNVNCIQCNGVTMAHQKDQYKTLYCPKCNKNVDGNYPDQEQQKEQNKIYNSYNQSHQNDEDDQYYEKIINQSKFVKDSLDNDINLVKKNQESAGINMNSNLGNFQLSVNAPVASSFNNDFSTLSSFTTVKVPQNNSNQVSKKLGQKLLQGWTMLEQSCRKCNVPLMKNKKGDKICQGCGNNYAINPKGNSENQVKKQAEPIKKQESTKKSLTKTIPKQELQKTIPKSQFKSKNSSLPVSQNSSILSQKVNESINRVLIKTLAQIEENIQKQYQKNGLDGIQKAVRLIQKIKDINTNKDK